MKVKINKKAERKKIPNQNQGCKLKENRNTANSVLTTNNYNY